MAIVKRGSRVSRVSGQFQSQTQCSSSTDEDDSKGKPSRPYDGDDDVDSGAGSDTSDGSDVGEKGTELCQVGDQNCAIPYELFDLPDLGRVLSLDTWNYCLTEEERFELSAYLPDMDQETFVHTLKELLAGENFYFGSPLVELFDRLKGGFCQPRVARYREGLEYLQRKEHYHLLRKYQNSMVNNLLEMRETWENCQDLGIEERLRVWNAWKDNKILAGPEPHSSPRPLSEQKLEHLQKGKPGRPPGRWSKKPKHVKDEEPLEVAYSLPREKGLMTKPVNQSLLMGKIAAKGSLEAASGKLESKENGKVGKRAPKGILKITTKCLLTKHGQSEIDQLNSFSEIQHLETKAKPFSLLRPVGKWEDGNFVGEASFNMRKTRSRTKMNSPDGMFDNAKSQQALAHSNNGAGPGKSGSGPGRKCGRVKELETFNDRGVQMPASFGGNVGRFEEEDSLSGREGGFENSKRLGEGEKTVTEGVRKYPQDMSRERVKISPEIIRRYPPERMLFDDCCSDAEDQWENPDRQNTDQYGSPVEQYCTMGERQSTTLQQQTLSLGQEIIPDNREPDMKESERDHTEQGVKNLRHRNLEEPKIMHRDIKQPSTDPLKLSVKEKTLVEKCNGELAECLEGQSDFVENRRHLIDVSWSLDNSKRSDEGKRKKRKQRQIDDVMTFDLEKKQEESKNLESPQRWVEHQKKFKRKRKDAEKIEDHECLSPQAKKSEDITKVLNGMPLSNLHSDAQPSLCQQSHGKSLKKKANSNLEEDAKFLDAVVSNKLHSDSQPSFHRETDERKPVKIDTKMLKEDAEMLTGVAEMKRLHENSQLNLCQQGDEGKSVKRGAKKKLEDAKVLDGVSQSNGLLGNDQLSLCQEDDECKPVKRKAKKSKVDAEVLNGVAELNGLHDNAQPSPCQQMDDGKAVKKRARKKMEDETGYLPTPSSNQTSVSDKATADTKPSKKHPPLNIPPVVSSFPFSVLHLLSAVRTAMLSPLVEDISEVLNHSEKSDGERESSNQEGQFMLSHDGKNEDLNYVFPTTRLDSGPDMCKTGSDVSHLESERPTSTSSIPFQEIVKRVQMNPGDPGILETQEPLQDLVRGALKILASKTAPPGVKGWKPLAVYDKATRSWSWIGPVSSCPLAHEFIEVQTSPEAWGISHKMLLKLVEAFANWLKNGQETLQQIVLLPTPPPPSMPTSLDEKERFRDLRAQKSSLTITPSSDDMRAYFRREEVLRYSVPDRAFSYTAADGRKAVVAPLRRCGGKPTSKARDHFMLKPDRPPHVTILCLVRDAAARLPGSIGTRADVCTLIRDSQYIVEDVSDAQVNQVVSGALDRLHYERDPCVQFDGDRKLWVYLHTDRDEEDFEDDGTSSTKRWKRQKKDSVENSDLGPGHDGSFPCLDDQDACGSGLGFDFCSPDYNGDSSSIYSGGKAELVYNRNGSLTSPRVLGSSFNGSNIEDGIVPFIELPPSIHSVPGSMHQSHPMGWEVLGLNPLGHGTNPHSQEHITDEDFDNDTFSRERPIGLLSASLL